MAEFDLAVYMVGNVAFAVVMLRLGVEYIHYSFGRGESALIRVIEPREEVYGSVEHRCIRNKRNEQTE